MRCSRRSAAPTRRSETCSAASAGSSARSSYPAGTSPHTLRHTWASVLLSSGVPIFLVSRYAGHATIQTTADQYGHLVPGDEQAAELIRTTLDCAFGAGA
jgi:integrase